MKNSIRSILVCLVLLASPLAAGVPQLLTSAQCAENELPAHSPAGFRTVNFGSTRYTIPDAYAPGITPYRAKGYEEGKGYASFTLNLLVPDLKPQGSNQDGMTGHGWGRHLQALLEYGLDLRTRDAIADQLLSWGHLNKDKFSLEKNGCRLYRGNMTVTHQLHVCYLPGRTLLFECKTKMEVPYPNCEVHDRINKDTTVIYSYSEEYSDDAVLIDYRIRALVTSFMSSQRSNQQ